MICRHKDKNTRESCIYPVIFRPDKNSLEKVLWDHGHSTEPPYLRIMHPHIAESYCYYHLKKNKGLFDVTVEQIRKERRIK